MLKFSERPLYPLLRRLRQVMPAYEELDGLTLEGAGHEVELCSEDEEAWAAAERCDALIVDLGSDEVDGIALVDSYRRVIVGTVTSSTMDKTATVTVIRRVRDRRFHKFLTRRVKYHVHDEHNTAKVGDVVEIVESRPMSKTKRWRLLSTLSRAVEPEHAHGGHSSQGQPPAGPTEQTPAPAEK